MSSKFADIVARFLRYVLTPDPPNGVTPPAAEAVKEMDVADAKPGARARLSIEDTIEAFAMYLADPDASPMHLAAVQNVRKQRPRVGGWAAVALTTAASIDGEMFTDVFGAYLDDLPITAWPMATAILAHELNLTHQMLGLISRHGADPGMAQLLPDALRHEFAKRIEVLVGDRP